MEGELNRKSLTAVQPQDNLGQLNWELQNKDWSLEESCIGQKLSGPSASTGHGHWLLLPRKVWPWFRDTDPQGARAGGSYQLAPS